MVEENFEMHLTETLQIDKIEIRPFETLQIGTGGVSVWNFMIYHRRNHFKKRDGAPKNNKKIT